MLQVYYEDRLYRKFLVSHFTEDFTNYNNYYGL